MPRNEAKRITEKVEVYATDPEALSNNVTSLKGREGIRLRVGGWRDHGRSGRGSRLIFVVIDVPSVRFQWNHHGI